jgi:hypothetical protein
MMGLSRRGREHAKRRRTIAAQRGGDQKIQANHRDLGVPPVPTGDTPKLYRFFCGKKEQCVQENSRILVKKGTKCPFMTLATPMYENAVNWTTVSIEKHLSFVKKKF